MVTADDQHTLGRVIEDTFGFGLDAAALRRLLASEIASLSVCPLGEAPPEPVTPTLGTLLEVDAAGRAAVLVWAGESGPVERPGARVVEVQVGDDVVLVAVTDGVNWLRRPALPPAFYGTDRSPEVADDLNPIERPAGFLHHLATFAGESPQWRTDAWFDVLARYTPLAVALALSPGDDAVLATATDGTVFARPLQLTVGERLLLDGVEPDASAAVRAMVEHLHLDAPAIRLFRAGRDWLGGEVDIARPAVREELVDPLRRAVIAGADARSLLDLAAKVGGEPLLGRLRELLVQDGTVSVSEWDEISRPRAAG